jgi:hypothetical protein
MLIDKILQVLKNSREQIECPGIPTDDINNSHLAEIDGLIKILERQNPSEEGFYYWILQVGIHRAWVADGVDFTDAKLHDILTHAFRHAYGHELKGKVLGRPSNEAVAEEMGYKSVAEYLKSRKGD